MTTTIKWLYPCDINPGMSVNFADTTNQPFGTSWYPVAAVVANSNGRVALLDEDDDVIRVVPANKPLLVKEPTP